MTAFINQLLARLHDYRQFAKVLGELKSLSDREVRDLGISRADFYRMAHDTVYGDLDELNKAKTEANPSAVAQPSLGQAAA